MRPKGLFFSLDSYHTLIGSLDENVSFDKNPTLSVSLFLEPSFKPISLFEFEMNHWVLPLVSKCNSFLVLPSQHSFLFLVLWVGLVKSGSLWSDFEMSSLGWDLQWVLCWLQNVVAFYFSRCCVLFLWAILVISGGFRLNFWDGFCRLISEVRLCLVSKCNSAFGIACLR